MPSIQCPHCGQDHDAGTYACPTTQRRLAGLLSPGTLVDGKYRVTGVIGSGGMGVVYHAENTRITRQVALKMLLPEFVAHPELVERVEREAKVAGGLEHPNVVTILDLGTTPQHGPYIAMELLRGKELATRIEEQNGRLAPLEAVDVARQVLCALDAAHARGIVHRDLKPENVFLVPGEGHRTIAKVLDFGISKLSADRHGISSLTRTGTVVGTPQFMAPEQAMGSRDQDLRVDVYATGVLLYVMLTGRLPYEAENYNLLINAILNDPPIDVRLHDPGLDPDLGAIVMRALARHPKDRYASAATMSDALLDWLSARTAPRLLEDGSFAPTDTAPYGARTLNATSTGSQRVAAVVGVRPSVSSSGTARLGAVRPGSPPPAAFASATAPRAASRSARMLVEPPDDAVTPQVAHDDEPTEAIATVPLHHDDAPRAHGSEPTLLAAAAAPAPASASSAQHALSAVAPAARETSASIKLPTPLEWDKDSSGDGVRGRPWRTARIALLFAGIIAVSLVGVRVASPTTWAGWMQRIGLRNSPDVTPASASAPSPGARSEHEHGLRTAAHPVQPSQIHAPSVAPTAIDRTDSPGAPAAARSSAGASSTHANTSAVTRGARTTRATTTRTNRATTTRRAATTRSTATARSRTGATSRSGTTQRRATTNRAPRRR